MNPASFRLHINGLRAIAILGVLLYHLDSEYCPAGYFGVDMFLVISGYFLLRSLLKTGDGKADFRYSNYLAKKVWRIYPPMLIIAALTCAVANPVLDPGMLAESIKITVINCFGGADYYIDHMGGYFNTSSQYNPLLHFWYLAITLQLYAIAPLLVIPIARKSSGRLLVATLGTLGAVSLVFHILTTAPFVPWDVRTSLLRIFGMKSAYYHLIPRFWEVVAGYFILFLPEWHDKPHVRSGLSLLGIALCVLPFFLFSKGSSFVYPAVAGTMLLIRYGAEGKVGRFLGNRVVQWLGSISFSLYLVHWPIMVMWKYIVIYKPTAGAEISMIFASLGAGYVAWRWVERLRPDAFKFTGNSWIYRLFQYGLLGLPLLTAASYVFYKVYRVYSAYVNCPININETQEARQFPLVMRGFPEENFAFLPRPLGDDPTQEPTFLLLGDSHARHLYYGLRAVCAREKIAGVYLNNSCTPYWGYFLPIYEAGGASWDSKQAEGLLAYLQSQSNIRYVLIAQYWASRVKGSDGFCEDTMTPISAKEAPALISSGLRETCDRIIAMGKKVILLADVPSFPNPSPLDEYNRCKRFGREAPFRYVTQEQHKTKNAIPSQLMQELLEEGRVSAIIDLAPSLLQGGIYPARMDGEALYIDAHHLSDKGSVIVAEYLLPFLKALHEQ